MHRLMRLYDRISEEIEDAQTYAEIASAWADCPEDARIMLSLSSQELDHAQILQGLVGRKFEAMKRSAHADYDKLIMMEEFRHGKDVERIREVKRLHEIFAEHR